MHGPEDSNIIPRPKAAAVPIYPLLGWIQVANCTFRLPLYLFESSIRALLYLNISIREFRFFPDFFGLTQPIWLRFGQIVKIS